MQKKLVMVAFLFCVATVVLSAEGLNTVRDKEFIDYFKGFQKSLATASNKVDCFNSYFAVTDVLHFGWVTFDEANETFIVECNSEANEASKASDLLWGFSDYLRKNFQKISRLKIEEIAEFTSEVEECSAKAFNISSNYNFYLGDGDYSFSVAKINGKWTIFSAERQEGS